MSLLLNIDTHLQEAWVCLSENERVIHQIGNANQKEHASFVQPAIRQLLNETKYGLNHLQAVSVVAGPGSYTGLRVGMAAAKGLCYALQIPLITINSLDWMAAAAAGEPVDLVCPMIDARRNEVYTALYRPDGTPVMAPTSVILDSNSFKDFLKGNQVLFFGNGSEKFRLQVSDNNAIFKKIIPDCAQLAVLSLKKYRQAVFTDLAYSEPYYLKAFFSIHTPRQV
jgi:tRNA threonylcarbamoyladenosine biosynthesis protein TsaB